MDGNMFANMDFLERAPLPDEKRITREEFKTAVREAVEEKLFGKEEA